MVAFSKARRSGFPVGSLSLARPAGDFVDFKTSFPWKLPVGFADLNERLPFGSCAERSERLDRSWCQGLPCADIRSLAGPDCLIPSKIIFNPLNIIFPEIGSGLNLDKSHIIRTGIFNPVDGLLWDIDSPPLGERD